MGTIIEQMFWKLCNIIKGCYFYKIKLELSQSKVKWCNKTGCPCSSAIGNLKWKTIAYVVELNMILK